MTTTPAIDTAKVKILNTYFVNRYPSDKYYFDDNKFIPIKVFELIKDRLEFGKNMIDEVMHLPTQRKFWFIIKDTGDVDKIEEPLQKTSCIPSVKRRKTIDQRIKDDLVELEQSISELKKQLKIK